MKKKATFCRFSGKQEMKKMGKKRSETNTIIIMMFIIIYNLFPLKVNKITGKKKEEGRNGCTTNEGTHEPITDGCPPHGRDGDDDDDHPSLLLPLLTFFFETRRRREEKI